MAKRLVDLYQVSDTVEIMLRDEVWQTAVVNSQQHPGIWVQTKSGQHWFVTNSRHIRPKADKKKGE